MITVRVDGKHQKYLTMSVCCEEGKREKGEGRERRRERERREREREEREEKGKEAL